MASENDSFYRRGNIFDCEYRLYVGVGDLEAVAFVVGKHFINATLALGIGLWQGKTEASVIVTVLDKPDSERVDSLAVALREDFDQDCILITKSEITSILV